jgi:hypothetical protein
VSNRQTVLAALVLAAVCCSVMWLLEDFRQRKMIADLAAELEKIPTYIRPEAAP